ncbi:MAG: hypothetical protein HRU18_27510 [Pseudoalteromonas sp.]|uniref:hypothetical protein n=1 Tax=Pseudoalteromonas sp. TaxID=53249 RepID=UPI001DD5A861|nr:hypothetical protein [Pseudoalteromonas sp.]NRA81961.1 hypothetical protein [Pseudoalteromonas sp.]
MKQKLYFVADKSYDKARKSNSYLAITNSETEAQRLVKELDGAVKYIPRTIHTRGSK